MVVRFAFVFRRQYTFFVLWFFVVSRGFEDGARRAANQVDHGDEGSGVAVSAGSGTIGLEQPIEDPSSARASVLSVSLFFT